MNKLVYNTPAGGLDIMYAKEFVRGIPLNKIDSDYVSVPFKEERAFGISAVEDFAYRYPAEETYTKKDFRLNTQYRFSDLVRLDNNNWQALAEDAIRAAILREITTMTAKATPTFFLKDLSGEAINKLAYEHMVNFGSGAQGIHLDLGPYQKFFIIADWDDFKYYFTFVHLIERAGTEMRGALVHLKPKRWVMGRYENLTYLNEVSSVVRYEQNNRN